MDCLFCKMAQGVIQVPKVYEDESFFCIRDIQPQAKVHLLVIPKQHFASLDEVYPVGGGHPELVGGLFQVGVQVAREQGLLPDGFRSIINTHEAAGQTVFHLHLHIQGGEKL